MVISFLHSQSYKFTEYISIRLEQILFLHRICGIYMYIFQHNLANTLQQKGSDDKQLSLPLYSPLFKRQVDQTTSSL